MKGRRISLEEQPDLPRRGDVSLTSTVVNISPNDPHIGQWFHEEGQMVVGMQHSRTDVLPSKESLLGFDGFFNRIKRMRCWNRGWYRPCQLLRMLLRHGRANSLLMRYGICKEDERNRLAGARDWIVANLRGGRLAIKSGCIGAQQQVLGYRGRVKKINWRSSTAFYRVHQYETVIRLLSFRSATAKTRYPQCPGELE
jgi:hypothetical protein